MNSLDYEFLLKKYQRDINCLLDEVIALYLSNG